MLSRKKIQSVSIGIFVLFLVTGFILYGSSLSVEAAAIKSREFYNDFSNNTFLQTWSTEETNSEMRERRTLHSKQFRLKNGLKKLSLSSMPIHYQDMNGKYRDINLSLVDSKKLMNEMSMSKDLLSSLRTNQINKKLEQSRNHETYIAPYVPFFLEISKEIKSGYTVGKDEDKLTFIPIGTSRVSGTFNNSQNDQIIYKNAWKDTDILLKVLPFGLKEDIILNSENAPRKFSFQVSGPLSKNLTSKKMKITPAFLVDAKGIKRDVTQELREDRAGNVFIDMVFDDTGLTFPIVIDPTVQITIEGGIYERVRTYKVYDDFPDININQIYSLDVETYLPDPFAPDNLFAPVDIYLTKKEYGHFYNDDDFVPPGEDGREVVYIGSTKDGILSINGQNLRALWPDGGIVYGAAAYSPYMYATDYASIYYTITYDDENYIDTEPPSAPANLVISEQDAHSVTLSWAPSTDNIGVKYYHIYDGTTPIGYSETTSYKTYIKENIAYKFTVNASDAAYNDSPPSNEMVLFIDTQAPTPPTKLEILNQSATSTKLTWAESIDNRKVWEYLIFLNNTEYARVPSDQLEITLTGLSPNKVYSLTMKARDEAGNLSADSESKRIFLVYGKVKYFYDSANRVDYIMLENGQFIDFEYDSNGNIVKTKF